MVVDFCGESSHLNLSSPRAESARAVTGSYSYSYSGVGEYFLPRLTVPLMKAAVTQKRKVKNRSEGAKMTATPRATNASLTKIGVL